MPRKKKLPEPPPPPPERKPHERGWGGGTVVESRPGRYRALRARVRNADGTVTRPSRTFSTREAAEAWAAGDVEPDVLLVGRWLDHWLALRMPTISSQTQRNYREFVVACAEIARVPLADLTTDRLQAHTNLLLTRWARSHVHSWKSIISASLRAAVPRYIEHNPMTGVKLPKTQEQPPKAWTAQEVAALLRTAEGRAHEVWLWLSLGTGIRLGEARALLWSDVDVTNRTITVRHALDHTTDALGPTKSRKTRVIELPDELVPILVAHRVRQKPRERSVCTSSYSGTVPRPRTVHSWLQQLCADAGVTVLSPHSTRHTCASLMLSAGVPITEVSRILGHSSPAITMNFYAHFVDQGQRRGATAMGAVLVPKNGSETGPGTNIGARQTR